VGTGVTRTCPSRDRGRVAVGGHSKKNEQERTVERQKNEGPSAALLIKSACQSSEEREVYPSTLRVSKAADEPSLSNDLLI
jgi:hypothetical protein